MDDRHLLTIGCIVSLTHFGWCWYIDGILRLLIGIFHAVTVTGFLRHLILPPFLGSLPVERATPGSRRHGLCLGPAVGAAPMCVAGLLKAARRTQQPAAATASPVSVVFFAYDDIWAPSGVSE